MPSLLDYYVVVLDLKCLCYGALVLYLNVSCCGNIVWFNFRPWNKLAVLCSWCYRSYDPHAMECVIAVQGSYVLVDVICDILDKLRSMVGYISSLFNSGILSKPLHFVIGTTEPVTVKGVNEET